MFNELIVPSIGVLTYFLPAVLERAGYEGSITQANINLGYACFQFAFALCGAAFVDKIGRRPLMLGSMGGCCIVWIGMTVASALFADSNESNRSAAQATLAMIFMFGGVYSFGITPLQALYPVEVLSFEMRAKGMAFSGFAVAVGGMLNQFAWPISLAEIGWRTYIIFVVWDAVQWAVFYLFMPETKKVRSSTIVNDESPVLTSFSSALSRSWTSSSRPKTRSRRRSRHTRLPWAMMVLCWLLKTLDCRHNGWRYDITLGGRRYCL